MKKLVAFLIVLAFVLSVGCIYYKIKVNDLNTIIAGKDAEIASLKDTANKVDVKKEVIVIKKKCKKCKSCEKCAEPTTEIIIIYSEDKLVDDTNNKVTDNKKIDDGVVNKSILPKGYNILNK